MNITSSLVVTACALGLAIAPAIAQNQGNNANGANQGNGANAAYSGQQNGNNDASANNGVNNGAMNNGANANTAIVGANVPTAKVPQYWISDADIFMGSAAHTASVMTNESRINVESPQILQNQAQFMVNAITRASQDLRGLDGNAVKTNPNAVPPVRTTEAQLQAALGQARQLQQTLGAGGIGPTYRITLDSALTHLTDALHSLTGVANAYPGSGKIQAANYNFFAGNRGATQGAASRKGNAGRKNNAHQKTNAGNH